MPLLMLGLRGTPRDEQALLLHFSPSPVPQGWPSMDLSMPTA